MKPHSMYRALAAIAGVALSLAVTGPASAATGGAETAGSTAVLAASSSTLDATTAVAGPYYLQFSHSSKCVQVPGQSQNVGVALSQYTCVSQPNEWWSVEHKFTEGGVAWFWIRNVKSDLCMNVQGGSQAYGASIIQWYCGYFDNEYFAFWRDDRLPSGYHFVQSYHSGLVLNIAGGSTANGGRLVQYGACYCANEYARLVQVY